MGILIVIFAIVFATIVLSLVLAAVHDMLKWWFNEAHDYSLHIGEWTKKKAYIVIGIAFWIVLTLLVVGMN